MDDEKKWRDQLEDILEKEGYDITTADSGDSAIELINKNDFYVILTDIRMESEFRGIEVLEFIKEKYPLTPVIMLSAYETEEIVLQTRIRDAFYFFVKGEKSTNKILKEKVAEAVKQREIDDDDM